jgi:hypothetical protein
VRRRRSQAGLIAAGGIVIAAGFAIAIVEAMQLPKGSIWVVVGAAVAIVVLIRRLTQR